MELLSYSLVLAFSGGEVVQGGPLDVNPGLILWTVVTFIFLLLVLKKIAWKPILNSLNERENIIKESLEKAETARKEAEKMIADNK
ncbi:MAG: F0F1 ATP synthase subunit B, partial [Melioribacteraceae bacterium]